MLKKMHLLEVIHANDFVSVLLFQQRSYDRCVLHLWVATYPQKDQFHDKRYPRNIFPMPMNKKYVFVLQYFY